MRILGIRATTIRAILYAVTLNSVGGFIAMHSEVRYDSGAKWSLVITRYCSLDPWILTPCPVDDPGGPRIMLSSFLE